jgi:hypothetical protein
LVAVVHNRRALSARLLGAKSPVFDIEHLQLFSTASSRRLFRLAGFSDVRAVPIWNRYPLHYWIKLFPFPATTKKMVVSYTSQGSGVSDSRAAAGRKSSGMGASTEGLMPDDTTGAPKSHTAFPTLVDGNLRR